MRRELIFTYSITMMILSIIVSACDVFPTRTPEPPITGNSGYIPPTSSSIVLENFIRAVNTAEYNDYSKCFAAISNGQTKEFEFIASGTAASMYPGLFKNWNANTEIRNIKSIFASLNTDTKPVLTLTNTKYDNLTGDSVNITADYSLSLELKNRINQQHYTGNIYLNLYRENTGLWYINRWIDLEPKSDSTNNTWSLLKADFAN